MTNGDSGGSSWLTTPRPLRINAIEGDHNVSADRIRMGEDAAKEVRVEISRPDLEERVRSRIRELQRKEMDPQLSRSPLDPDPFESSDSSPRQIDHPAVEGWHLSAIHEDPDTPCTRGESRGRAGLAQISAPQRDHPWHFFDQL